MQLKKLPDVISGHARLVDSSGIEFNACPKCAFRWCPMANDPAAKCDVADDVDAKRAAEIENKNLYKDKVVAKHAARGKVAIVFKQRVNIHE